MSIFSAELRRRVVIGFCTAWLTLFGVVLIAACLSGCGAAGRVTTAAACSTMLVAIGEAEHLEPARAHADLESQSAICSRLAPDAGASP